MSIPVFGPPNLAWTGGGEKTPPNITLASEAAETVTARFQVSITADEPVIFRKGLTVVNGWSDIPVDSGDHLNFTVWINPTLAGTVTVTCAAGDCHDFNGNPCVASDPLTRTSTGFFGWVNSLPGYSGYYKTLSFRVNVAVGQTVVIDWGDGQTTSCTGNATRTHTYPDYGKFCFSMTNPDKIIRFETSLNTYSFGCKAGNLGKLTGCVTLYVYNEEVELERGEIRLLVALAAFRLFNAHKCFIAAGDLASLSLTSMFIQRIGAFEEDFSVIAAKTAMTQLSITGQSEVVIGPNLLKNLTNLTYLAIDGLPLAAPGSDEIAFLTKLIYLYIYNCNVAMAAGSLAPKPLQYLGFYNAPNVQISAGEIKLRTAIKQLVISKCPGAILAADDTSTLVNLTDLELVGCPGVAFQTGLGSLKKMVYLAYYNNLSTAQMDSIFQQLYSMGATRTGTDGYIYTDSAGGIFEQYNNARPSGIARAANPPTSGMEYAYEIKYNASGNYPKPWYFVLEIDGWDFWD